jgi:hypothetical protein
MTFFPSEACQHDRWAQALPSCAFVWPATVTLRPRWKLPVALQGVDPIAPEVNSKVHPASLGFTTSTVRSNPTPRNTASCLARLGGHRASTVTALGT